MTMDTWSAATGSEVGSGWPGTRRDLEYHFLTEHLDGGFIVVDERLCINEISSLAAVLLHRPTTELMGQSIEEVMAPFGFAGGALRHVLRTGEETHFDLPIEGREHSHLRVRAFLWPRGVAMILRACQEDRDYSRLAEHLALEKALATLGQSISARLTVRGTIASADPGLASLIGVPSERIAGARLVDLVTMSQRTAARGAIEQVLTGRSDAQRLDTILLTNHGTELPVRIAIAPLGAGAAIGGAMMVLTTDNANREMRLS
jgi:PAS domain-containing protein